LERKVKKARKPNAIAIASAQFFRDNPCGAFGQTCGAYHTWEPKIVLRIAVTTTFTDAGFRRALKVFGLPFGETKLQPLKRKLQIQRFELDAVTTAIHGVPRKTQ
jgi:hypothetical protein